MNYCESREYINRISKYGSVLGLDSITSLLAHLDNPQDKIPVVHFAGTNGKGSTIAYTESILLEAGYKVGKYTSPAVFHEREVFQINGEFIREEQYAKYMSMVKAAADEMVSLGEGHPTPFEVETALAFVYFCCSQCDVILLETGMGGETDATNVVNHVLCSVITSISMDHMTFLGDDIKKIAKVKAGIIKNGCPVVLSRQTDIVTEVIKAVAKNNKARLIIPGKVKNVQSDKDGLTAFDYECEETGENGTVKINNIFRTRMAGSYQPTNAATAIEVAKVLEQQGFQLNEFIEVGIENAKNPGRFEKISDNPVIVVDGAHNPGAAEELKNSIEMYFTNSKIAFIMGVLADKDYQKVVEITAPLAEFVVTVTPDNPRALKGDVLMVEVQRYNVDAYSAPSIESAVAKAIAKAGMQEIDVIIAFGSLSYLAEVKKLVLRQIDADKI